MYARIVNELDYKWLKEYIRGEISVKNVADVVMNKIENIVQSLDTCYGSARSASDMGGNVFVLTDDSVSMQQYEDILQSYHILKDAEEYSDIICREDNKEWLCELYMIGSDDAIVIIYVRERRC